MSRLPGEQEPVHVSRGFWVGFVLGVPVIAYGLRGATQHLPGVQLTSFGRWFVGVALVHDLAVGPLAVAAAWLTARRLPRVAVAPVQAGLLVTAVVGLVSWPFVRGYGVTPGEPSFLSRDYTESVLTIWVVVWSVTAAVVAWRLVRRRTRRPRTRG